MEVQDALEQLVDVSPDVEAAVAFELTGRVTGSTLGDDERSRAIAAAASRLFQDASALRAGHRAEEIAAVGRQGALVAVRHAEGAVAAVTARNPAASLALHDVRTCVRALTADADAPLARGRGEDDASLARGAGSNVAAG
jgi:predicted regulator of Ras-like GTPase activity (Roadblock/LC7/MglB family)